MLNPIDHCARLALLRAVEPSMRRLAAVCHAMQDRLEIAFAEAHRALTIEQQISKPPDRLCVAALTAVNPRAPPLIRPLRISSGSNAFLLHVVFCTLSCARCLLHVVLCTSPVAPLRRRFAIGATRRARWSRCGRTVRLRPLVSSMNFRGVAVAWLPVLELFTSTAFSAHPCAKTGPTPFPRLHPDWAQSSHVRTGTGLTPATSAP